MFTFDTPQSTEGYIVLCLYLLNVKNSYLEKINHKRRENTQRWPKANILWKGNTFVIQTVKGFGVVSKAKVDVFLELSCFFDDPVDVGDLISGSSAFSKTSLNIWKFMVHVLLKPGLGNFEHYFY